MYRTGENCREFFRGVSSSHNNFFGDIEDHEDNHQTHPNCMHKVFIVKLCNEMILLSAAKFSDKSIIAVVCAFSSAFKLYCSATSTNNRKLSCSGLQLPSQLKFHF